MCFEWHIPLQSVSTDSVLACTNKSLPSLLFPVPTVWTHALSTSPSCLFLCVRLCSCMDIRLPPWTAYVSRPLYSIFLVPYSYAILSFLLMLTMSRKLKVMFRNILQTLMYFRFQPYFLFGSKKKKSWYLKTHENKFNTLILEILLSVVPAYFWFSWLFYTDWTGTGSDICKGTFSMLSCPPYVVNRNTVSRNTLFL